MRKWLKEWGVPIVIAVIGAALFRTYGFAQIQVFDVSMQNTFFEGHRLIETKYPSVSANRNVAISSSLTIRISPKG